MTMRPPHKPLSVLPVEATVEVKVIGASTVPAAMIVAPGKMIRAGASPSDSTAEIVTPASMVNVAPSTKSCVSRVWSSDQVVSSANVSRATLKRPFSSNQDHVSSHSVVPKAPLYVVASKKSSLGTESTKSYAGPLARGRGSRTVVFSSASVGISVNMGSTCSATERPAHVPSPST